MTVYKKNGKYYCRFQINNQRIHKCIPGAATKNEAISIETSIKYDVVRNRYNIEKPEFYSVSFMMNQYINVAKAKGCSLKEPTYFSSFFIEYFGENTNILSITPSDVRKMMLYIIADMNNSTATANRYRSALRRAYNILIKDEYIAYNPVRSTEPFLEDNIRQRYLTHLEWKSLKKELPLHARMIVMFDLYTGFRLKNVLLCKWEQFDFNKMCINITRKMNKGRKIVQHPISNGLYKLLQEIGIKKEGYLFINPRTNKPYTRIDKSFSTACRKANIKDLHFHDLRRTVGTWLLEEGVDIRTIQEILWHSDISTTQRYLSLSSERSKYAMDLISNLL